MTKQEKDKVVECVYGDDNRLVGFGVGTGNETGYNPSDIYPDADDALSDACFGADNEDVGVYLTAEFVKAYRDGVVVKATCAEATRGPNASV